MDTPVTLLESSSPYGSRRVTVEYDGLTTAAYLHDGTSVISATWIANHRPAPQATDQARVNAGRAPLMSQSRIDPSLSDVAIDWPSGAKRTARTSSLWPSRTREGAVASAARSHRRIE